ncbi:G-protein coupled receptor 55 [Mugil cephalus]|uniref:G-protein coupled receptor 55 n=1 Tax=Mugil cephalus TaxID=48193 RepID=UPI001FB6534C|nr:G-protein coupled receptor 55 [Mugil cephalus]
MAGTSANMTNCSFDMVDKTMRYMELIIYVPIFSAGLFLNGTALLVFCFFLRKWTESTIYMTSLALMDMILLLPLPFKMHATNHKWSANKQQLCSVLEGLYFVAIYGSIYTIMCIAGDRWVAICHPFRAKQIRSVKAALGTCIVVWVLMITVVFFIMNRVGRDTQQDFHCFHEFSKDGWRPGVIIPLQVFGFLVPALMVIFFSVHTIYALQKSGRHSPQSMACTKIIYSSLSAFLVPFTPSHFAIFLQFLVHQGVIENCSALTSISLFLQVTMCLSNITCCLDALCYYFIAKEVRNTRNNIRMSLTRRPTFSTSEV